MKPACNKSRSSWVLSASCGFPLYSPNWSSKIWKILLFSLYVIINFQAAFTKLRKATISFVMSVPLSVCLSLCLSVCLSVPLFVCLSFGPHGATRLALGGFLWNAIYQNFSKIGSRIMATIHEEQYTFFIISRSVLLRIRNVSDWTVWHNQNIHFMFNNFFFSKIVPFMR
jgi:hypothetical protein